MAEMMRLQKYLASKGYGSRRKCEEFIGQGIVKVNGETATLGMSIDPEIDKVEIQSEVVEKEKSEYIYIMLNKPVGYITSLKQEDSDCPLVVDLVKGFGRIYPVGRLDKESSGLIILTNDGEFAFKLTHPSFEKEKEYLVETRDPIALSSIDKFRKGIKIEGKMTYPAKAKRLSPNTFTIVLSEGRNRQIRKMVQKVGNEVVSLKRIRIKDLKLGDLEIGKYRLLSTREVESLIRD
ncbi:MAG: rRNA pseudouridine synthase [Candidatus Delongbacteria bacterium]|nr:rRNA pseudouridine synthase [Candidatus Delongbacteria bacterium]MBN2835604.1 rRNA pseudouridine synthase [Candidatus Delongbacteria bacterium]